ncbi:MAG: DUF4443 domain-containing protein [Candidatus Altiarchaeota archaeon]|nr:DUF4443 domain-containing protein [Candidatus Altiarchaeota archaeon]
MVGAAPSFSDVHILRALLTLHENPTGRKKLVQILGLGEGSVRTIIKHLTEDGLIKSSSQGHKITEKGEKTVLERLRLFSKPNAVDLRDMISGMQSLIVVYGAVKYLTNIVLLRDTALRAGADGALVLVCDGDVKFPDSGMSISDYPLSSEYLKKINLREGDVVVIGFAPTVQKAEDGALAATLELLSPNSSP